MNRSLSIALAVLTANAAFAAPKILICTNQMNRSEANQASHLQADGTWFLGDNSPDVDLTLWRKACAQIGTGIFVAEDGGISPGHLMGLQLTPRIRIQDSLGNYVSGRPAADGNLYANVPVSQRTDWEAFSYAFIPNEGMAPIWPTLTQLPKHGGEVTLRNYAGNWMMANGGGSGTISAPYPNPGYWERFRLHKLSAGDNLLRSGSKFAIQTWNGIFNGGCIVASDLNWGGQLQANRPYPQGWETFTVTYPCEFMTAIQIAPVTREMAYHEFSDVAPGAREYTLNSGNIDEVARRVGGSKVIALARSYVDLSHAPGVLPTLRQQVVNATTNSRCKGLVWEITAGGDLNNDQVLLGMDYVLKRNKECYVLIAPRENSTNYSSDVKRTLNQLKTLAGYDKLILVLAAYERSTTKVGFIGGSNTVEGALKWVKANR